MGDKTGIEWTRGDDGIAGATWNPTTGCDRVSPGCDNCYALGQAKRLKAMGQAKYQTDGNPATSGPGFGIAWHPDALAQPLRWTRPRRIFVNSMSDLFHAGVPDEFIAQVFAVMALTPRHTYQVLTKRHGRMRSLLSSPRWASLMYAAFNSLPDELPDGPLPVTDYDRALRWASSPELASAPLAPLPNVWLGVSAENQQWADIRTYALLDTPASVRFLSCEPLLGPIHLHMDERNPVDWVIVGGESGPRARPMHPAWARQLRDQCVGAGVPFFFKQWGQFRPGGDPARGADWITENGRFAAAGTPAATAMVRVGKHAAGRVLDGWTWDQFPAALSGAAA